MKTTIRIFAMMTLAAIATVACNVNDDDVLSYDNETLIGKVVPSTSAASQRLTEATGNVTFTSDANLAAFCAHNDVTISNAGSSFSYKVKDNEPVERDINGEKVTVKLTRDIQLYLEPAVRTKYKDYGYYTYPFRIRQYGDYTQYLTAAKVNGFSHSNDKNDQYYILGTVTSVGTVETDSYPIKKYPVNPQYFYDRGAMPSLSDEQCPTNLAEKFLTITVDMEGTQVKVLINDLARDSFIDNLASSLKSGQKVEISLHNARWDNSFGGLLDINPFAVFAK